MPHRPLRNCGISAQGSVSPGHQEPRPTAPSQTDQALVLCPWSGHVKNLDRVFLHEDPELVGSFRNSGMKMQPRLFMLPRKLHRFLRPAAQGRFNRKQNRSVTITHIPFGPLNVCSRSRFFQRILRVNRPIFGLPTVWAPSPAFDVVRQRPIQGGPVPSRFARRKQF